MTNEALRAVINQHTCVIDGLRYQFRLQWWATEKVADPGLARNLLNVECIATTESATDCVQLHLLVLVKDVAELPAILEDALLVHLALPGISRSSDPAHRDHSTTRRMHDVIARGGAVH